MRLFRIAAVTIVLIAAAAAAQAAGCGCPRPGFCPTELDCSKGWQWSAPNTPMSSIPTAWDRQPDGSLTYRFCYITWPVAGNPYATNAHAIANSCVNLYPDLPGPTVTLRFWCEKLRALDIPPATHGGLALPPPSFQGVCGS